ncbi:MAG: efflux RND transporter permease subunit, partial [Cyanobacteria bacterium P01_E01_bin.6]
MIRILIIDDMKTIRQMVRLVEEHPSDMEIVGATADGSTGLEQIAKLQPDIALVDLDTPGVQGMDIVRLAVQKSPNTKILRLTSREKEGTFYQALHSKADGYLLKTKLQSDLVSAIRSVLRGGRQFSHCMLEQPSLSSTAGASGSDLAKVNSIKITSVDATFPNPRNGWNLFFRNLRLLLLTLCLIVVSGVSSFALLPRMEDPVPSQRLAIVTTQLPGASAQRVESLITDKIETALLEIKQVDSLYSTSQANSSVVVVQLKDTVTEVDPVWARVRDKLSDVEPELPIGTSAIGYEDVEPRAVSKLIALSWTLDTPVNSAILGRLSKELGDRLLALDGTAKVEFFGAFREEISVEIRPHQLAALGLSIPEVAQQIEASDAKVSAGHMRNGSNDLLIEMESELDSLNRIRQIPIRNSITSQFTRLGDVAWVHKSIQDPPSDLAIVSGKPAITLALLADSSQRIDRWSEQVNQILESVNEHLSPGVELTTLFDQSDYVDSRL